MRGAPAVRRVGSVLAGAAIAAVWLAGPVQAIEFWDERVQIHGYYETVMRSLWTDFDGDDWDLSQWQHILNLEIEADLMRDARGPLDLVSAFARVEVRYDCVWTRACGIFRSADMYGDRSERLAGRVADARRSGYVGNQFGPAGAADGGPIGDQRRYTGIREVAGLGFNNRFIPSDSRKATGFPFIPGFDGFFSIQGPDGMLGTLQNPGDDPGLFTFSPVVSDECQFGVQKRRGSSDGVGSRVLPWRPGCKIRENGTLRNIPNPLNPLDRNPTVLGLFGTPPGSGALPLRPAPEYSATANAPRGEAQGIFLPSANTARLLREDAFHNTDQNFRQAELEWNRGASQQDEKELKELYLDIEMFDSRLWIRAGKQNIVWGKTELFRTTDQFNPQDLALASLPSLEESRIALWALRAVWSFYEVGPLSDVRLEVAMNYDQFEPTDLGRCGEPYSPLPVCDKTYGLLAHGVSGVGIAGEIRSPDPWNSWKGIEVGGRLEFRYDRFSVAITDFWGYNDTPFADQITRYARNVDPLTGRPRRIGSEGSCRTGHEESCLTASNALREHSINQQVFHMICSGSVGFSALDPTSCGQTVFTSAAEAIPGGPAISSVLSSIVSGSGPAVFPFSSQALFLALVPGLAGGVPLNTAQVAAFTGGTLTPMVPLSVDPNDGGAPPLTGISKFDQLVTVGYSLSRTLTPEQEALLGCGPFYGTSCDAQGIDLMNAEASALIQSWPFFEGTFGTWWDTTDASVAQPGTVGFNGGPVCTRYERGRMFILPGCRGPGDPGYNVAQDGSISGPAVTLGGLTAPFVRVHPFTGQRFKSEMSVLSWNLLMALVGFSGTSTGNIQETNFDPSRPFRDDGCSFKRPQYCGSPQGLIAVTSVGRPDVRAGGSYQYGRRDFTWASGGEVVLRYEKRNVLGASVDFAEDVSKSNWSLEFTWIEGQPYSNANEVSGLTDVDTYNLTVSVDRPTFINFLNANRTFFFNSQWFFQYVDGYERGFTGSGPWNTFFTFTISTGYLQDRLLPSATFVYDFRSNSGAFLPQVSYRFTENFSASFGVALFAGREEARPLNLFPTGTESLRVGSHRGDQFVENGLAAVRERDEIFMRLRYTF